MGDAKLDPRSLNAEERAIVDHQAFRYHSAWKPEDRYRTALDYCEPLILARRAIFGEPASEGKVECPNCLQPEEHPHFAGNLTGDGGWYFCPGRVPQAVDKRKPSQPELSGQDPARSGQPASEGGKVECPNCRHPVGPGWDHEVSPQRFTCKPAQPEPVAAEMPESVKYAAGILRLYAAASTRNGRYKDAQVQVDAADALESFWRAHAAQPAPSVAMPEAA